MTALSEGTRAAAHILRSSRHTVRKWLRRFEERSFAGLRDRSRAPRHIPRKTPPEQQRRVLDARGTIPSGLSRYQFTGRIVPEGGIWLATSAGNESTCALLFADRLLTQAARCGVKLEDLVVQTDNGSEFGGD